MNTYFAVSSPAAQGKALSGELIDEGFVRVLIVDDDEDDYLIAKDLLAEIEGVRFLVHWISDPALAISSMVEHANDYDVCLLDYRIGRYNGLDMLREAVGRGVTLPIILLTGQEDHEVDREAVRIGASDYLVKGRINSVLLDRAIRYARQQRGTQEALRRQTEFVSAVLDTAGALVVVLDREGRIARFNRQCEVSTGYSFAEVEGRRYWEFLLVPEEEEAVRTVIDNLAAGHGRNQYENDWLTRTGERRRIAWSNTTLVGQDGQVEYVVSTGIDVTERRQAEEDLALARERELEVGASIQKTLLIRKPPLNIPGLTFGARSLASQKVGGDYFDFFVFGESVVDVVVGDVMGKGVPAALLAAATKGHFQRAVRRLVFSMTPYRRLPEPEEVVAAVHSVLTRELVELNSFVTLSYARFDLIKRRLIYVDCGHPRPLHYHAATGVCTLVSGDNVPLGMNERELYRQITTPFEPGDVFFLYSDGVTEACDETDELYGESRLVESVSRAVARGSDPQELTEQVIESIEQFCAQSAGTQGDDLTCVSVRIEAWEPPRRTAFRVMEMRSIADDLEVARAFVSEFCATASPGSPLEEDTCDLLTLAVNEAVANVIEHAYCGRTDGRIQIEAETYVRAGSDAPCEIRFRLYDNGGIFQGRENVPQPSFDGSREEGFGLFIMQQCFDDVEHSRDEMGRNCVTLVKRM